MYDGRAGDRTEGVGDGAGVLGGRTVTPAMSSTGRISLYIREAVRNLKHFRGCSVFLPAVLKKAAKSAH
jgi:hypothetical protein